MQDSPQVAQPVVVADAIYVVNHMVERNFAIDVSPRKPMGAVSHSVEIHDPVPSLVYVPSDKASL
jgi:hypothetical protein